MPLSKDIDFDKFTTLFNKKNKNMYLFAYVIHKKLAYGLLDYQE